jgi:ubiquinone/menaquinone biosynthesis C-methylase UbiE
MSTAVRETNVSTRPENNSPNPTMPPDVVLTQMIMGSIPAQAIYVAAKLGISDLLAEGPKTVEELASTTNVDASSLYRVLRALASFGVYFEEENKTFKLTPLADLLRSDSRNSLRDMAVFMGEDWHWNVWAKTLYSVQTGKPAWPEVHGQDPFPYLEANPDKARIFDKAMTSLSHLAIKAVVDTYDFSGVETLIDIAGGQGRLLSGVLEANPSMRGVLFDLPYVLSGARELVSNSKAADRVEFVSGDFFESVPSGGDAYILKHIIHDWDDERALLILKNIKQAMNSGARVLLVEAVIAPANQPDFGKLMDIEMLVAPGGKERTEEEYKELFAKAGLRLTRIVKTESPYSVIEAVAA